MRPSIVILTGDQQRHRYFVNCLAASADVRGVVAEAVYHPNLEGTADDIRVLKRHFAERDTTEQQHFTSAYNFEVAHGDLRHVPKGELGSPATVEWIRLRNPDYLVLYGSSIVGDPLLSLYEDRVINMHLGLSPYYRGSGTNFWPLRNREPELVGVTIHLASREVDGGKILKQARPRVLAPDKCHDIGCRAIATGTDLMAACVREFAAGRLPISGQQPGGRVYRRRDFTADAVRIMRRNFDSGMIEEYLAHLEERQRAFPIIEWAIPK